MKIGVVTSFSWLGHEVYGQKMIDSFAEFWPDDVDLHVYYEGELPMNSEEWVKWHSLDADQDRAAFIASHNDHPVDYRRQPVKFCHKVFAVTAAPRDYDWLIWLDGDVVTKAPVTREFLWSLLPPDVTAVYLGRKWWLHSECGFVAYNLMKPELGPDLLNALRECYKSGAIDHIPQQHDCMMFDIMRELRETAGNGKFLDLAADYHGPGLDVMPHTPLGKVMTHHKGPKAKRAAYGAVA